MLILVCLMGGRCVPCLTSIGHIVSIGATIIIVALILGPTIYHTIKIIKDQQCKGDIFITWAFVISRVIIAILLNLTDISVIGKMAHSLFEFINNGKELYYMDWLL